MAAVINEYKRLTDGIRDAYAIGEVAFAEILRKRREALHIQRSLR